MNKYSDLELDLLRQFWQNSEMRDVVFKVLTQDFSIPPDPKLDDKQIGEKLRAIWAARDMVKAAFQEIETFNQKVEIPKTKLNQAR